MKHKVVSFPQPDCPPCQVVKLFLEEKGVPFEDGTSAWIRSLDPSAVRELTEQYNSHSTPTLVIGEEVMIGFDPERLDDILGE